MSQSTAPLPEWVLVGGAASAIRDADQVLANSSRSQAGKRRACSAPCRPLAVSMASKPAVRQRIRDEPLETAVVDYHGARITVPTEGEILRIKGVLILTRNATRDYLDFVALAAQHPRGAVALSRNARQPSPIRAGKDSAACAAGLVFTPLP